MKEITPYDVNGNKVTALVQWDKDVTLTFRDTMFTTAHPVQFFNRYSDHALVVESKYESGILSAKIPNILLRKQHDLAGYVNFLNAKEERCLVGFKIRVLPKPQPSDYVYEDTVDYVSVEAVLAECRDYAEYAREKSEDADAAKAMAYAYAYKAEVAQYDARQSANSASSSAVNANAAKVGAEAAEDNAREYANTLAGYVGAITTSVGWDTDGYFSFFEYDTNNTNEMEE